MHLENSSHTLFVLLNRVVNAGACVNSTGINTEEAYLTNERVGGNLKRESGERLCIGRMSVFLFTGLGVGSLYSFNVGRSRHIIYDSVKERLNALVPVGSTAGNRNHIICYCGLTDYLLYLFNRRLFAFEVFFHQFLVLLNNMLDKLGMILVGKLNHILGDGLVSYILTEVVIIDLSVHINKVYDSSEGIFRADRQLNRNTVAVETLLDHIKNMVEISTHNVHLVNIDHSRYMIFVSLTPNGLRLRLNTALSAQNGNRTVKYTE